MCYVGTDLDWFMFTAWGSNGRAGNKVQQWCFQAQQQGEASVIDAEEEVATIKNEMEIGYKENGETDG